MVDCGESDEMIKINGKWDKIKDLVVMIFHSLFKKFLQTKHFFF